jgi:hypothetical protein
MGHTVEASGYASHATGAETKATNHYSHAQNYKTEATHRNSSAAGYATKTSANEQFVIGRYNANDKDALFIVGNGVAPVEAAGTAEKRTNAFKVLADGRARISGQPLEDADLTTKEYVDNIVYSSNIQNGIGIGSLQQNYSAVTKQIDKIIYESACVGLYNSNGDY